MRKEHNTKIRHSPKSALTRFTRASPDAMIAVVPIPPLAEICFAPPAYREKRGRPGELNDRQRHNCIRYRFQRSGRIQGWRFDGAADRTRRR